MTDMEVKIFDFDTLLATPREKLAETVLACDEVDLEAENLSDIKTLRFKDNAKTSLPA